jgi:cytochrome oxidase assembly protein ShyY1
MSSNNRRFILFPHFIGYVLGVITTLTVLTPWSVQTSQEKAKAVQASQENERAECLYLKYGYDEGDKESAKMIGRSGGPIREKCKKLGVVIADG